VSHADLLLTMVSTSPPCAGFFVFSYSGLECQYY